MKTVITVLTVLGVIAAGALWVRTRNAAPADLRDAVNNGSDSAFTSLSSSGGAVEENADVPEPQAVPEIVGAFLPQIPVSVTAVDDMTSDSLASTELYLVMAAEKERVQKAVKQAARELSRTSSEYPGLKSEYDGWLAEFAAAIAAPEQADITKVMSDRYPLAHKAEKLVSSLTYGREPTTNILSYRISLHAFERWINRAQGIYINAGSEEKKRIEKVISDLSWKDPD